MFFLVHNPEISGEKITDADIVLFDEDDVRIDIEATFDGNRYEIRDDDRPRNALRPCKFLTAKHGYTSYRGTMGRGDGIEVALVPMPDDGGSCIFRNGLGRIPLVLGTLDFAAIDKDIYENAVVTSTDLTIEGTSPGTSFIATNLTAILDEPFNVEDRYGNVAAITLKAIVGETVLVEYERAPLEPLPDDTETQKKNTLQALANVKHRLEEATSEAGHNVAPLISEIARESLPAIEEAERLLQMSHIANEEIRTAYERLKAKLEIARASLAPHMNRVVVSFEDELGKKAAWALWIAIGSAIANFDALVKMIFG